MMLLLEGSSDGGIGPTIYGIQKEAVLVQTLENEIFITHSTGY